MKSYSQYDEQQFILAAFEGYGGNSRRFVDIGAFHPTDKSNTRALYELGWGGVCVEPSPVPMQNLLDAYGFDERVQLIQAAVALDKSIMELYVTDDAVSTVDTCEYDKWKKAAKFRGRMFVPTITLGDISNQFGGFDFWNLDAEGISGDLFLEAMRIGYEPRCYCVEHDGRMPELMQAAALHSYTCTYANGTNMVLVR